MSPNGFGSEKERHDFVEKLDREFSKYRNIIDSFSTKYNLQVEKYYHDFPSWSLLFQKRDGIYGKIDISFRIEQDDGFDLYYILWKDDFKNAVRKIKEVHYGTFLKSQPSNELEIKIENMIKEIDKINIKDLVKISGPYDNWKKTWKNEEDFLKSSNKYPVIKI